MASDGQPVKIPAVSLVHGSQAPVAVVIQHSGKALPPPGKPAQFRVAPDSNDKLIQEVNPANGEVLAEFPASEFAALARSVGISGVIVDKHA